MIKRYFYDNESLTIRELAKKYNIMVNTLRWRLAKGWTLKASLTIPVKKRPDNSIYYDGRNHTLRVWANILNISYKTLYNRVRYYKWAIVKAFTTPPIDARYRCKSKMKYEQAC